MHIICHHSALYDEHVVTRLNQEESLPARLSEELSQGGAQMPLGGVQDPFQTQSGAEQDINQPGYVSDPDGPHAANEAESRSGLGYWDPQDGREGGGGAVAVAVTGDVVNADRGGWVPEGGQGGGVGYVNDIDQHLFLPIGYRQPVPQLVDPDFGGWFFQHLKKTNQPSCLSEGQADMGAATDTFR